MGGRVAAPVDMVRAAMSGRVIVWDVAGGTVLIQEAGGIVTNVDGTAYDPFTPDALASNGPLHPMQH